jgi:hypothetical protein
LNTFNLTDSFGLAPMGWSQWLRPEAFKVFVEITDDNAAMTATAFETALLQLSPTHFGAPGNRNFIFHSITGLAAKANPAEASRCPTGVNPGSNYQDLSIATGGLRFPVCTPSLFNTVFRTVAEGVVAGAQVACDFAVPPPPPPFTLSNRITVQYTPGSGGAVQSFSQVADASQCAAASFYVQNARVQLCPAACGAVRGDTMAKIDLLFSCEGGIN